MHGQGSKGSSIVVADDECGLAQDQKHQRSSISRDGRLKEMDANLTIQMV
jgi:hypothetical protein